MIFPLIWLWGNLILIQILFRFKEEEEEELLDAAEDLAEAEALEAEGKLNGGPEDEGLIKEVVVKD